MRSPQTGKGSNEIIMADLLEERSAGMLETARLL